MCFPVLRLRISCTPSCIDSTTDLLQVISNSTGLLNEMLASETDPREGFVSELAEQCVRMKRCEPVVWGQGGT